MPRLADPFERLDSLIPTPTTVESTSKTTQLPLPLTVAGPSDWVFDAVARLVSLGATTVASDAALTLRLDESLPAGGYRLAVEGGAVTLDASDACGAASGISTLVQLLDPRFALPAAPGVPAKLAQCNITDAPLYPWRGSHVDVARHFYPLPWLFAHVDTMAAHKLNVLHLHLTDDQGWRFEVPGYPLLTEVGASRVGTRLPTLTEQDGIPHGGFYTGDQLRALVEYARQRGITVVPEIDVPGHVRALLAAYPEYGRGEHLDVPTELGIHREVLWPDEKSLALVKDIFTELLDVFDSPIIHIGGDECPTDQWRSIPEAAALAQSYGLDGVHQLQHWFTLRLVEFLAERGRRVIGWDEIVDEDDVPGAIVMSWQGVEPGRRALAAGHPVVMAPAPMLYFDYYPSDDPDEPLARDPACTWQDIVAFDPAAGIPQHESVGLLGIQGQIWTEFLPNPMQAEYLMWPRLTAMAEVAWRGPADPVTFEPRLEAHLARLDVRGVNFRPLAGPRPWQRGGTGVRRRTEWVTFE